MENMDNPQPYNRRSKSTWVGIIILCAGVLLLLHRLGLLVPEWIFTWPMILIVIGLVSGANRGFRNPGFFILVFIGVFFLARQEGWIPFNIGRYFWPAMIILIGLFLIVRPGRSYGWRSAASGSYQYSHREENMQQDTLDSVSVFTGVRRNISSKSFKGGEVVNVFGSTELNFMQADINGTAVVDVVAVFGGVKIYVPADWEVQIKIIHVFGDAEDKRPMPASTGAKKVLMLTGTVIFGSVDVRSF